MRGNGGEPRDNVQREAMDPMQQALAGGSSQQSLDETQRWRTQACVRIRCQSGCSERVRLGVRTIIQKRRGLAPRRFLVRCLGLAIPVPSLHSPTPAILDPVMRDPAFAAMTANTMTIHPMIVASVPVPVSRYPYVPTRHDGYDFVARRRRCDTHVHVRGQRRHGRRDRTRCNAQRNEVLAKIHSDVPSIGDNRQLPTSSGDA